MNEPLGPNINKTIFYREFSGFLSNISRINLKKKKKITIDTFTGKQKISQADFIF